MKSLSAVTLTAFAICATILSGSVAQAIDRDADMIDSLDYELGVFSEGQTHEFMIFGETATATPYQNWAILAGLGYTFYKPDAIGDFDSWHVSFGVKRYLRLNTSLSVLGTYGQIDLPLNPDLGQGEVIVKHRFTRSEEAVSPFATARLGYRSVSDFDADEGGDLEQLFGSAGLGCEFMMNDSFSFVFKTSVVLAEGGNDVPGFDDSGWLAGLSMAYYWD